MTASNKRNPQRQKHPTTDTPHSVATHQRACTHGGYGTTTKEDSVGAEGEGKEPGPGAKRDSIVRTNAVTTRICAANPVVHWIGNMFLR